MQNDVTREGIEALIDSVNYNHHEYSKMTCFITLKNGSRVTGESIYMGNPIEYSEDVAKKVAYEDAIDTLFKFENYRLQWELYNQNKT
jgi:hypothetical protein